MVEVVSEPPTEVVYHTTFHAFLQTLNQAQRDALDLAAAWLRRADKPRFQALIEGGESIEENMVIRAAETRLSRTDSAAYQAETADYLNWIFCLNAITVSVGARDKAEPGEASSDSEQKAEKVAPPSPTTAFVFIPKPSLIGREQFGDMSAANRAFASALHADLVASTRHNDLATLGRLIAVAVVRCGVLSQPSLRAFVRALRQPVYASGPWWHLELQHTSGQGRLELRRLFLDAAAGTVCLVDGSKLRQSGFVSKHAAVLSDDRRLYGLIQRAFKAYRQSLGLSVVDAAVDLTLTDLIQSQSDALALTTPPFLLAVARRLLTTHSIPLRSFHRLTGVTLAETEPEHDDEGTTHRNDADENATPHQPYYGQSLCHADPDLEALKACFIANSKAAVLTAIGRWRAPRGGQPDASAILCLGDWMDWCLRRGLRTGHACPVSTARLMLDLVGLPWLGLAPSNQQCLHADLVRDALSEILESVGTPSEYRRVHTAVAEFGHFLSASGQLDQDLSVPTHAVASGYGVSAELLSHTELRTTCKILGSASGGLADPLRRVAVWILVCAFYCGLRRNEALHLRVGDLHLSDDGDFLLIRPHALRRLKSPASQRMIPLAVIPQKQRDLVARAVSDGDAELAPATQLVQVLCNEQAAVFEWRVIPAINRALKLATGNTNLHLHHARHCAASNTLLQLMRVELPLDELVQRADWLAPVMERAQGVGDALLGHRQQSRKHLWAASALLGHASIETTMGTYVHSSDLLLWAALRTDDEPGCASEISGVAGVPLRTVTRWMDHRNPQHVMEKLERRYPDGVRRASPGKVSMTPIDDVELAGRLMNRLESIYRGMSRAADMETCPAHLELPFQHAKQLSRVSSKRRGSDCPVFECSETKHGPLLGPLVGARQLEIASWFSGAIECALQADVGKTIRGIRVLVNHQQAAKGRCRLPDDSSDQEMLEWLLAASKLKAHVVPTKPKAGARGRECFRFEYPRAGRNEHHAIRWVIWCLVCAS